MENAEQTRELQLKREKELQFEKELKDLINKYSIENESDTPDFILAQYIINSLMIYRIAIEARDRWTN